MQENKSGCFFSERSVFYLLFDVFDAFSSRRLRPGLAGFNFPGHTAAQVCTTS